MSHPGPIVAAIDFSASSAAALRQALRLSRSSNADLVALHVVDSRVLEGLMERVSINESDILAEIHRHLDKFVHETIGDAGDEIELQVTHGHPFDELLNGVKSMQASLLVMGSHGTSEEPNRIGVIAAKCVRKAPADVLLVHPSQSESNGFRKVLTCVDFSDNSVNAADQATTIAEQEDGGTVEFLNVYQPLEDRIPIAGYFGSGHLMPSDDEMMEAAEQQLEGFVQNLIGVDPDPKHTLNVISSPSVARGIAEHANKTGADLIVIGTRGNTGLDILLLGTTAEKVIHHAACSTLAVKPRTPGRDSN